MKYQIVLKLECMVYHIILDYKSLPHTNPLFFVFDLLFLASIHDQKSLIELYPYFLNTNVT